VPLYLQDRAAARIQMFRLIHEVQTAAADAAGEISRLLAHAERRQWADVARLGLFGEAVAAWFTGDEAMSEATEAFLERSLSDGDGLMTALGLAMRSSRATTRDDPLLAAAADADLARAVVLLENAGGGALERITARTACGIAFGDRSFWELADEQYAAALAEERLGDAGRISDLLAAVVYNRAELQVAWASTLRQVGDVHLVAERRAIFDTATETAADFPMPAAWRTELAALGVLLAAVAGEDRADEAKEVLGELAASPAPAPRAVGHLQLAVALSDAGAGRPAAAEGVEEALRTIDPHVHPHEFELALHIAAELEGRAPDGAGSRYARHQLAERWSRRLAALGSMQSRIEAERLSAEYELLSRHAHLDDLTGVGNRRALERYVSALSNRRVESVAFIMADVDDFKGVNDEFGHTVGDAALVGVAHVLESIVRAGDLVVRLGGDEFAVVLANADLETARARAQSFLDVLAQRSWAHISPDLQLSVSVGVTAGSPGLIDEVAAQADMALYDAKAGGGNRVVSRQMPAAPGSTSSFI